MNADGSMLQTRQNFVEGNSLRVNAVAVALGYIGVYLRLSAVAFCFRFGGKGR
jgi:hypothetical protein